MFNKDFKAMKQELIWGPEGPLTVYEWSLLSLDVQLQRRPLVQLIDEDGIGQLDEGILVQMPKIVCADGTTLSVQAGKLWHCSPENDRGPWTTVEVGYPSVEPPETWKPYAEGPEELKNTVFSQIPLFLVLLFIGAHGGVDREATFSGFEFRLR